MLRETKVMIVSIIVNMGLAILKMLVGLLGGSGALVADGVHSLSDLTTDFVAIFGNKMARKPADMEHPYGHGKTEYLTSMIIGLMVLVMGGIVLSEAFQKQIIIPQLYVIFVSLFTIICKFFLARYIEVRGKKLGNSVLIASGRESYADVFSSIFVLISIGLMQLNKYSFIFGYADMVAIIVVGIFIIRTGYKILKENVGTILGERVSDENYMTTIKNFILEDEDIFDISEFTLLKYGPYYNLSLGVVMNNDVTLEKVYLVIKNLRKKLKRFDKRLEYITVHAVPIKK